MTQKTPITVSLTNELFRVGANHPQRQDIPEQDKTPQWYFKNASYYLSFYNKPIGSLRFDSTPTDRDSTTVPRQERLYPVQHMIRMMMYYLGKQNNLDYAYLTQNVKDINMQAQWYKGQDVQKFVNHFRGLILQRISNANWSAKSVSKEANSKWSEMYSKLEIALAMKPYLQPLEKQSGIGFSPLPAAQDKIEIPEDIEREMTASFVDESADVATALSQGMWLTNGWMQKSLKSFMHCVIAGTTGWWHKVHDGRQYQEVVLPYQMIWDNRFDDDFGAMDEFRGVVTPRTAFELQSKWKNLTSAQVDDIYEISKDNDQMKLYNTATNISWWGGSSTSNTVTEVTLFWRTMRPAKSVLAKNEFGNPTVRKPSGNKDEKQFPLQDIAFATIVGNKYLVDWGYVDNLVESVEDPARPEFPIQRFRPNTFLGDSVSEVSRIYRIQDEMDMLDYSIRTMIGRAKGKSYIINGDKVGDSTIKELWDDFADMGIHVTTGTTGESNDSTDKKNMVEVVDLTLDPGITRLQELYAERALRMGSVLSTSQVALGQQTRYLGFGQQQSALSQGQLGIAYLIDGFLDFLVMNMRYSVNQGKNLYALEDNKEIEFLLGDKGIRYLKFTKDIRFERFMIALTLNDNIDEEGKKFILQQSQVWGQNQLVSPHTTLAVYTAKTFTEAKELLNFDLTKTQADKQKQEEASMQAQHDNQVELTMTKAAMEQLIQDNENFRKMYGDETLTKNTIITASTKATQESNAIMMQMLQAMDQIQSKLQQLPPSPLEQQMASQAQQQQQAMQQQASQQQQSASANAQPDMQQQGQPAQQGMQQQPQQ